MDQLETFTLTLAVAAAVVIVAVMSSRISALIRVPAPALFLLASSAVATFVPRFPHLPLDVDVQIVSVALVLILFDGGLNIGLTRFRASAGPIVWLGVAGTLVTAAALAALAHFALGLDWRLALLIGAALAPTDPAVVFSVLGRREIAGRSGTMLEGESGANDPVGIALIVSLLAVTGSGAGAVWAGVGEFALQLGVGAAVGAVGGWLLTRLMQRVSLPNDSLYSIRTIAAAVLIYAVAALLHGSGFLAVLLAGIIVGDVRAPFKREIERFSAGGASLAEIVAFTVLGLGVNLKNVVAPDVLWPALLISAVLIFVIRPILVGAISLPIRLRWGERAFVLWSGLKGAVPILLGLFILGSGVAGGQRIYDIIYVVVLVSVLLQGSLVPVFARAFRVPMTRTEPEPWAAGMRFSEEPEGLTRLTVEPGSAADGTRLSALPIGESGWISVIRRDGRLLKLNGKTVLEAGDDVLAISDDHAAMERIFAEPAAD